MSTLSVWSMLVTVVDVRAGRYTSNALMMVFCSYWYQYRAKIIPGNRYTVEYRYTGTLSCHFVFTMYELVLKGKLTLLVWNYFEL